MNNLRIPLALSSPTAFELSNHLLVTLQRRRSHLILSLGRTRLHGTKKRNGLIDFPRAMPIGQNRRRRRRRHGIPRSESQQHQYQRGSVGRHEVQPPSAGDAHGGGQPYGCGGVETLHRVSHVAVGVLVQVFEYQCGSEESHAGGGGRGYSCRIPFHGPRLERKRRIERKQRRREGYQAHGTYPRGPIGRSSFVPNNAPQYSRNHEVPPEGAFLRSQTHETEVSGGRLTWIVDEENVSK